MSADEFLTRVESAAAAATDGPWEDDGNGISSHFGAEVVATVEHGSGYMTHSALSLSDHDAEFIILMRDAGPRMAAALRAVLAACDEYEDTVGKIFAADIRYVITADLDGPR